MKTLLQLLIKKAVEKWIVKKCDTEKNNLIEEDKKIGIGEVIKQNQIINKSLKSQI